MLQQTRVATVVDYYERWMERFPDLEALAAAEEADVLHAFQGLGYYSRARNLRNGARAVVRDHGGKLPQTAAELRALPGLGPYSAGAVASIAFGERTPVVDGNVVRVLCRLYALRGDPARAPLKQRLWQIAESLVPATAPSDWNQALMELGARICTPRSPNCADCPVQAECAAKAQGAVERLPETAKRREAVVLKRVAALIFRRDRVLVVQVPSGAPRWAGMWQFPNGDVLPEETEEEAVRRVVQEAIRLRVTACSLFSTVRHAVTFHRITLDVYRCRTRGKLSRAETDVACAFHTPAELESLAMPSAHRQIARRLANRG